MPLDLALVIPVWNDAEGLRALLAQAQDFGCFRQIIVVDDGSDRPVVAPGAEVIRHPAPLGGGVARNAGLARVTCRHLLFFDADDRLERSLLDLLADLDGRAFDFCLFKHADSRVAAEERWGQIAHDEFLWQAAGVSVGVLQPVPPAGLPVLAQTANYPWNKVYRTAFLRDNGIGCGSTRVHQDIPLHWLGFLAADTVLVSDRICAWHGVAAAGGRLSNLRGAERLEVFDALEPVAQAVEAKGDAGWQVALAAFLPGLMDWVRRRIDPALHDRLDAGLARFLAARAGWIDTVARREPALAEQLRALLREAP